MYTIRTMVIEDYKNIISLWEKTEGVGLSGKDDSKKSIKIFLDKNPNTCFVAETDEGIVGTIMAGNDGRRGHIYHLMVKPEHRKKGIGKKLLEKVEKSLRKAYGRYFWWHLRKINQGIDFGKIMDTR